MFSIIVAVLFAIRNKIVLFLRKTENGKPHSELFLLHHPISPFSEVHNRLYILWHSKLRVKKCTPSLFSQSIVGQFAPTA